MNKPGHPPFQHSSNIINDTYLKTTVDILNQNILHEENWRCYCFAWELLLMQAVFNR